MVNSASEQFAWRNFNKQFGETRCLSRHTPPSGNWEASVTTR